MTARKLVKMNSAVVGVGERDDVLDVERTEFMQSLIDSGIAEEIDAKDAEGVEIHDSLPGEGEDGDSVIATDSADKPKAKGRARS